MDCATLQEFEDHVWDAIQSYSSSQGAQPARCGRRSGGASTFFADAEDHASTAGVSAKDKERGNALQDVQVRYLQKCAGALRLSPAKSSPRKPPASPPCGTAIDGEPGEGKQDSERPYQALFVRNPHQCKKGCIDPNSATTIVADGESGDTVCTKCGLVSAQRLLYDGDEERHFLEDEPEDVPHYGNGKEPNLLTSISTIQNKAAKGGKDNEFNKRQAATLRRVYHKIRDGNDAQHAGQTTEDYRLKQLSEARTVMESVNHRLSPAVLEESLVIFRILRMHREKMHFYRTLAASAVFAYRKSLLPRRTDWISHPAVCALAAEYQKAKVRRTMEWVNLEQMRVCKDCGVEFLTPLMVKSHICGVTGLNNLSSPRVVYSPSSQVSSQTPEHDSDLMQRPIKQQRSGPLTPDVPEAVRQARRQQEIQKRAAEAERIRRLRKDIPFALC